MLLAWGDVRAFSSLMFYCCLLLLGHRSDWESFPGGLVQAEFAVISQNHQFYSAKCVKQHKCFTCPGVKAFSEQGEAVGSALLLPGGILVMECRADGSVNMGQISQNTLGWKGSSGPSHSLATFHHPRLLQTSSRLTLNLSSDGFHSFRWENTTLQSVGTKSKAWHSCLCCLNF